MRTSDRGFWSEEQGFSFVEVLVALLVTVIVMAAVYGLLAKGQESFRREPEVADLTMSARVGLNMINRDLLLAGLKTPPALAVTWTDGGGINPDEVTIVYADPDVPTTEPWVEPPGGKTIKDSSTLVADPSTMDPGLSHPEEAYSKGMILFVLETEDCNNDGQSGVKLFELTQNPKCNGPDCERLNINHNPAAASGLNFPQGFNGEVQEDCAIIGYYHVVQYRINPPPPTPNPVLERRDLAVDATWIPVSNNIENLQLEYAPRGTGIFSPDPAAPVPGDPATWVTGVRVTVAGRSQSTNLQGASEGVFSPEDTHLRKTFSTVVSLRNVLSQAELAEFGGGAN